MFASPVSRIIVVSFILFGCLLGLLTAFALGVSTGERKARHTAEWCQNYGELFRPHPGSPLGKPFVRALLPAAHGVFGRILSINETGFVMQGKDGIEQNILILPTTVLRLDRQQIHLPDVRTGMDVSILGVPNAQGQIEAQLIRVFKQQP